jgi:hypothetical protein
MFRVRDVAGLNTGTEAGAPPGTNAAWNQLEGHRPRCPQVRMFRVRDVGGFSTGTEAGAPPGTNVAGSIGGSAASVPTGTNVAGSIGGPQVP